MDARKARLLARSAAYADAFADATVPAIFPPAERQALSRRSTCAALAMATRTPERTIQRATNDAERLVNEAPAVLASLEAGRISARHAQVITDQLCDVPTAGPGSVPRAGPSRRGAHDGRRPPQPRPRPARAPPPGVHHRPRNPLRGRPPGRVRTRSRRHGVGAPLHHGTHRAGHHRARRSSRRGVARRRRHPHLRASCRRTPSRHSRSPA